MKVPLGVKRILRKSGFSITRVMPNTDSWARRAVLMSELDIDLVLDVGAFIGGYGMNLREIGYTGEIFSFEPQPDVMPRLRETALRNPPWRVFQMALSDFEGQAEFFISERGSSSSLKRMCQAAKDAARAETAGSIPVDVRTIDKVLEECGALGRNIYLKCDAQGAEEQIMCGGSKTIQHAKAVEIELSIAEMYEGQWDFRSALDLFLEKDFEVYSIEAGFADPVTGQVMQVDAIFTRRQ